MTLKNYIFNLLLLVAAINLSAQDKVVFKDGRKLNCKIISINPTTVTYRDSISGDKLLTVPKADVLMAEYKSGSVYIFGNTTTPSNNNVNIAKPSDRKTQMREKEKTFGDNIIGIQIPDILMGRFTLTYERLFLDKQIGVTVPISLAYDRRILFQGLSTDTSKANSQINRNLSYVTGLDINYYFETRSYSKFFVGPRFRYGTDVTLGNFTGYSVQFQQGFLLCSSNGRMASTFAIGFGFVRVLSVPGVNPGQSYPWGSFTFRLGFRA